MSKHTKYLTTAALAAALGAWASQAHADLSIGFEGPAIINAGDTTFSLVGTITAPVGTSVGILDVAGIFGGTLSNGDVIGAFSNPQGNSLFSVLQPGIAGPGGTWGTAASPYTIRSTAVDVNGAPVASPGVIPAGGSLSFTLGTITFNPGTFSTGGSLSLEFGKFSTSGTAYPNAVWTEGTTTYSDMTADAGALTFVPKSVTVEPDTGGIHAGAGQTVTLTSDKSLGIADFSVDPTGKLDLASYHVAIEYTGDSPIADLRTLLNAGRNPTSEAVGGFLDGQWNGATGIVSNTVAAYDAEQGLEFQTVGMYDTASMLFGAPSSWGDITLDPDKSYILLGGVWNGDLTASGACDDAAFSLIGLTYGNMTGQNFHDGDLNFDGTVDDTDFSAIGLLYGSQGPLAPAVVGAAVAVVPEPASLALLAIGGLAVLRRRR